MKLLTPSNHSREGISELARTHLENGQARLQLPAAEGLPPGGSKEQRQTRQPLDALAAIELLKSHYLKVRSTALSETRPLSEHRQMLGLQLGSTLPYYLQRLCDRLGIELGKDGLPSKFGISEPLSKNSGDTRGHYTAPFSVVEETGNMRIMQHGASTLLHEVVHALGRMTFGIVDDQGTLRLRQSGLSIYSRGVPSHKQTSRLFGFFDEALTSMTQNDFLCRFMGFEASNWFFGTPFKAGENKMVLNGHDIWKPLERTGVAKAEANGEYSISLAYQRYSQGKLLSSTEVIAQARIVAAVSGQPTPEQRNAVTGLRDREFLMHDSGYGVITYHMQEFAQELFPNLEGEAAKDALHACLLRAQLSGNLRLLTAQMKKAFGADAGLFIKALASLDNFRENGKEPHICAFVAFVKAGLLPEEERRNVRMALARAILGHPVEKQSKETVVASNSGEQPTSGSVQTEGS